MQPLLENLLDDTWQVWVFDWSPPGLTSTGQENSYGVPLALSKGQEEGRILGLVINWSNYDHVHLVAHSAGSAVITMMAAKAHGLTDGPTVHLTYLDSYAGVYSDPGGPDPGAMTSWQSLYGKKSDWSDHYVTRDVDTLNQTYNALPHSHNVDVSELDPNLWPITGFSSHTWPRCFWLHSMTQDQTTPTCNPCDDCPAGAAIYNPHGYRLSKEWLGEQWNPTTLHAQHPPGGMYTASHGGIAGGSSQSDLVYRIRNGEPINPLVVAYTSSGTATVAVNTTGFTATTAGLAPAGTAWINIQVQTSQLTNFLQYQADFTSAAGSEGLITVYVDGEEVGSLDERYADAGVNYRVAMVTADLLPGTHTIGFRLDRFGTTESAAVVSNIALGRGAFVKPGDFNVDDQVNGVDLAMLLTNWGPCKDCKEDINQDQQVDGADLAFLFSNWG